MVQEEFDQVYVPRLEEILRTDPDAKFVVGDYYGVDEMAQRWFVEKHLERLVTVYHMFSQPRAYASYGFALKGGFLSDEARDAAMTRDSDTDVAFVRPGKRKSGTAQNLVRRWEVLKEKES